MLRRCMYTELTNLHCSKLHGLGYSPVQLLQQKRIFLSQPNPNCFNYLLRVTCFWGYIASRAVKNLLKQHALWRMFEDEQVITFQLKVKFKQNFRGYFWDSVCIWEILGMFYPQNTVTLWYHFLQEMCLDTGSLLIYIVLVPVNKKGNNYWSSDYYPITLIPYCGQRYGKNKISSAHQNI